MKRCTTLAFVSILALNLAGCGSGESEPPADSPSAAESQTIAGDAADSPESRVGITREQGETLVVQGIANGNWYNIVSALARGFRALPGEERGEVIWALALCARAYVESNAFDEAYSALREQNKPTPPNFTETVDEEADAWLADTKRQLQETRQSVLPQLPEAQRADFETMLAQNEAMYADPKTIEMQRQMLAAQRTAEQADYVDQMQRWELDYPADPKPLVVKHLTDFIAVADAVDFDAQLTERDGKQVFVNPDYERKSPEWRWTYRAGRQAVASARKAAEIWLEDLR
jgi:hypothetical protein